MYSFHNSTKQLSEAELDTAILSVGSTEQCGPCLPLHLDTLVAAYFADAWGQALTGYVLPTLPFNTSEEHAAFTGTVTLRPTTVMMVLEEIVEGLRRHGFRKQVLTVGHGGSWWMDGFIKQINWQYEDIVVVNAHIGADSVWNQAVDHVGLRHGEIHGGVLSRAIAAYLAPNDVLEGEFGLDVDPELLDYNGYLSWETITRDGSWGRYRHEDADIADAETGKRLLEYFVARHTPQLRKHVEEAARLKDIS